MRCVIQKSPDVPGRGLGKRGPYCRKGRILAEKTGLKGVTRSSLVTSKERLLSISEAEAATSVEMGVS